MTEILTESFCERCGTRYTFESAAPRKSRLGRVRVVSKGLRNFVMQDESTLSEAMADARSDEERAATAHQLDAFHKTFNFCMTCRQYTCGNCWNTVEGRCLTCAPVPGMDLAEIPGIEVAPGVEADVMADAPADLPPEAWPEADLAPGRLARAMGVAAAAEAIDAEAASVLSPDSAQADAVTAAGPQVIGLAPGQSLEDALAAYEAEVAAAELAGAGGEVVASAVAEEAERATEAEPEPEEAAQVAEAAEAEAREAEPVEAIEAEVVEAVVPMMDAVEPVAADVPVAAVVAIAMGAEVGDAEAEAPEPGAVEESAEPVETEAVEAEAPGPGVVEPVSAAPVHDDIVEQPTWPVAAAPQAPADVQTPAPVPEPAPVAEPVANPWLTVAPDDGAAPQWPVAAGWTNTAAGREMPTTLAGRPLLPRDNAADLWAASAREVLSGSPGPASPASAAVPATPQPCVSCGLSLSANARFCRRCGTRQG
jgi:hypothetical protein